MASGSAVDGDDGENLVDETLSSLGPYLGADTDHLFDRDTYRSPGNGNPSRIRRHAIKPSEEKPYLSIDSS
ncbi:uncharacterized protein PG986_001115 [Apiospora aurea]|uniref:Uncharacterized protein n=1 Tax=Apiospora aurea TaxID=335848 RepID=A0ABR1QW10_9PEZI